MRIAYCIKCGNKFPEEAVFCPYCGTKVFRPEDDKTVIKPEDVIVDIPSEPVVAGPVSQPESLIEVIGPKVEGAVPSNVPIVAEPTIKEDGPKEEAAPVEANMNVSEAEKSSEMENMTVETVQPNTLVDEEELEDPKIGVCILAFFFPIVGFIAAGSNRGTNKKKSKTYAMWAWIGFGLSFITKMLSATI